MTPAPQRLIPSICVRVACFASLTSAIAAQAREPYGRIEEQVIRELRERTVGGRRVMSPALPEAYLRRVADRLVRSSFEQRYRIVLPDDPSTTRPASFETWPLTHPPRHVVSYGRLGVVASASIGCILLAWIVLRWRDRG